MVRYTFDLASRADDAQLRYVLQRTPMRSSLATITYEAEPSFFDSSCPVGAETDVIICRDVEQNMTVGFGCRSIRKMFVNGEQTKIGYLSSLRCIPAYRNQGLVARGYRAMRKLHESTEQPKWYFTTILEGNPHARNLLTSGRAGLPFYHAAGRFSTFLIPVTAMRGKQHPQETVQQVEAESFLDEVNELGRQYQLFPYYESNGWLQQCETDYDARFFVSGPSKKTSAVLGVIDQRCARQLVVKSYPRWLQWCRHPLNCWYRLTGKPVIHKPPYNFKYVTAVLPLVDRASNAESILPVLKSVLEDSATRHAEYVALGMHESHQSYDLARRISSHTFDAEVFLVSWELERTDLFGLDGRPFYLELGWL
ncbi:MAG: hypothetical protein FI699_00700 [SAR202 cluster bacterium]|nr:hypothetical protein [SAR202 cluster bacterium]|tara:strand:+ start:9852 stop:10952 length:1101 start_codon:yes stop_codon:yes gene_type:complete